ncbi:MAG: MafI family immunity protein [Cyanobacteria bacterium P01_A01_bin.84]
MINHKSIIEQLEKALYLTRDVLIPDRIEGISSCIHAGEWGIAFEILCENLYEYESPISKQVYELLEEIGSTLKIKKYYWENLKPQISSDS